MITCDSSVVREQLDGRLLQRTEKEPTITELVRSRLVEANHELVETADRIGAIGQRLIGEGVFSPPALDTTKAGSPVRPTMEEIDGEISTLVETLGRLRSMVDVLENV